MTTKLKESNSARYYKPILAIFVLVFSLIIVRAAKISAFDTNEGRSFLRGDGFSDINTLSAVNYFYDFGFWKSKFRPIHQYKGHSDESGSIPYTHYPALPDILVGCWATLIGSTQEFSLRVFPILLSVFWFFLIFHFLNTLLLDRRAGFIGASSLVLSNYFIAWADVLHKHTFEEFFKWCFIFLLYTYYKNGRSKWLLAVLCLFSILIANTSFEPITFLAVTVVGFSFVRFSNSNDLTDDKSKNGFLSRLFSIENVSLGIFFISGFLLHLYLNKLYFGSWELTKADLWEAFLLRTNQCLDAASCGLTVTEYLQFPLVAMNRWERYFLVPGLAGIVFFILTLRHLGRTNRELFHITIVLTLASFSWYFIMPQHAWVHHFVGKQIGILYGIIVAVGGVEYWQLLKKDFQVFPRTLRTKSKLTLHGVFCFYIFAMILTQQIYVMYWLHGFKRLN